MKSVYFDFNKLLPQFAGTTISSKDKSIILCDNSATCPAEDVLTAYQKYGKDCVHHLDGAFSFMLWDAKKEQLMVVRDRIGERPMYYAQLPTGIVFSTDLKEILPQIKHPAIRPHELAQPIRHNYPIDLRRTWIEQINRLQSGEYAIVDKDGLQIHTYWKRDERPTFKGTKREAIDESLRLMRQSVKRCIETADGPVAVLLSGGIDSSSLAVFAKEIQSEVHVLSAGYKGNQNTSVDERPVARQFAKEKGLIYHEIELDVNDFQSYLNKLTPYLDEPCFDINCMVQFALYKKAAEMGYKTILMGLGGDEQFYSYAGDLRFIRAMKLHKQFIHLYPVSKHRKEYIRFVLKHWKHLLWPTDASIISERNPESWVYDDYMRFSKTASLKTNNETIRFADIDVAHRFSEDTDLLRIYDFTFSTFASTLCVYMANKMCTANGIEVRFPLLDPNLVTFLDSLPLDIKFDWDHPKQFQKDIMAGIVPDYILYARKRGFTPPVEFIRTIAANYQYKQIQSDYCFFNSMVADQMIDNLLKN